MSTPNPLGAQTSGAAVNSSTNAAAASPGSGTPASYNALPLAGKLKIFSVFSAFINAALYIVIGMMSLKSKRGEQVKPMMPHYGAPQSAPYQVQPNGSNPSQAPPKA